MDIFSQIKSIFGKQKSAGSGNATGVWENIGGPANAYQEMNALAANSEWVGIAVDLIAKSAASVRIKVMRYQNGDDVEVFNGPLYEFLENPGDGFTGKDFVYLNTVYKELTGNAFWQKDNRKVIPLLPTHVRPNLNKEQTKVLSYRLSQGGHETNLAVEDVLHDRYIDPARPYWGVGKLTKIAKWIDTSTFATEFLRRFFLNGASFGGFITTEEETAERIAMIKAGLQNDHVGVHNAHKVGVLPKGSDYKRVTGNMSEIEMGATDDRYRDKILAAFGVPKSLVGLVEDVNRANAEANEYMFARYTIKPVIEDLMDFLNVYVAKTLDPSGRHYFDYDEFVPVNMDLELREREIALNRQAYKTVNEVRSEVGLEAIDGGDVVYGPPFQQPLGSSYSPYEPITPPNPKDDNKTAKKPRRRGISARVRKVEEKEVKIKELAEKAAQKAAEYESTKDPDEVAHKSFVGRVESYLERVAQAVILFNDNQKRRVIQDLNQITKAVSKGDLYDMNAEIAVMVDFVEPLLRGLMTEQAMAEYEAQGFEGAFDSGDAMLRKVTEQEAKRLAKTYNATTAKLLKSALDEGIKNGEGLAELTKRVQEVYGFSDVTRAKMVAHTESFHIANQGSLEAYRQSGVVTSQRWYTAEDERVCPHCYPMNGTVIDIDEKYFEKGSTLVGSDGSTLQLNYRAIDTPPLHSNCRCFIRPETITIE